MVKILSIFVAFLENLNFKAKQKIAQNSLVTSFVGFKRDELISKRISLLQSY